MMVGVGNPLSVWVVLASQQQQQLRAMHEHAVIAFSPDVNQTS
jgi:hypothetical protein